MSPVVSNLLIVAAVSIVLFAGQSLFANNANEMKRVTAAIATLTPSSWHFVAMEYCYGILNRTYIVLVTQELIVGVRVRGPMSAPVAITPAHHNPDFYLRPRPLEKLEHKNIEDPSLVSLLSANFQIRQQNIAQIEFTAAPKWGMGTLPYSGRILLRLRNGKTRELILLGDQNGREIQAGLQQTQQLA
jgi:hypothetical protein